MTYEDLSKFVSSKRFSSVQRAVEVLRFINDSTDKFSVCLACSGGSDSVFLLHYILQHFPDLKARLIVLHFNHGLRGTDSDADEKFVENLAAENGINFYANKLSTPLAKLSEEMLRKHRNEFFQRALNKFSSHVLILGHNKNDIAETMLMRLVRASDIEGLCAPREVTLFASEKYIKIRPILRFSRAKIEAQLKKSGHAWREDSSNAENNFFRNKIRNIVLPQLQAAAAEFNVIDAFSSVQKNLEEANEAVDFFVREWLERKDLKSGIVVRELMELPIAVRKKIFAAFLSANGVEVRKSFMESLVAASTATNISAGRGKFIRFDGEKFVVHEGNKLGGWAAENLKLGENKLPNGKILTISKSTISSDFFEKLKTLDQSKFCYAAISDDSMISAKSFKPHYKYVRVGHKSAKKLGDLLTSKILKNQKKHDLPVIFVDNELCWAPGLPVSDRFKVERNQQEAVLLTYS